MNEAVQTLPTEALLQALFVFVLAAFVGYEVVSKVPTMLHTPLMSGANAVQA
jgi:NAD(P) transhydrogenase subunit alpha